MARLSALRCSARLVLDGCEKCFTICHVSQCSYPPSYLHSVRGSHAQGAEHRLPRESLLSDQDD